jgi:hypothetical protein
MIQGLSGDSGDHGTRLPVTPSRLFKRLKFYTAFNSDVQWGQRIAFNGISDKQ